ncbi:hypothetical protein PVAND_005414 [Polypedilum vanderplanki]|uniref:Ionotropic receptor n=1 Tax=Polypedilum vanderplanki TaxID=319348 RepID=A0A9J6C201_POLVA|nr:hypothetical protein PVAND_005414 [Polypedilum vanderplanki]
MLLHLLLISSKIPGAFTLLKDFPLPKYSSALSFAVIDIIQDFYVQDTNTINIYQVGKDEKAETKNYDIINEILYHVKLMEVVVRLENFYDVKEVKKKRAHNLIFVDNFQSFMCFFNAISSYDFEFQGFFLIILTTYSYEQYTVMSNIFAFLWNEYITNVNIVWETSENEAIMYTYFPYTNFYCGKSIPVQLNQFSFGKWLQNHSSIFPEKMTNLHRCPLSAAIVLTGPFMSLLNVSNDTVNPDGIDGVLLRVISQRMNFTLKLVLCLDQGMFYENGTIDGAAKLVIDREVNMTIGYTPMSSERNYFMMPSYIYHTSNLIWIVPPGRLLSSMEKLGKPFGLLLWIFVSLIFIVSFFTVIALKFQSKIVQNFVFGREISTPSLNILNVFFGNSLHKLPKRNFARFILGFFMFYCLVIRSSYQGALFNFMRGDFRESHVKTIEAMAKRDFKFHVVKSSLDSVHELPEVMNRISIIERGDFPKIKDKLMDSNYKAGVLGSEEHVAWLNQKETPEKFYHYTEEVVSVFNLCIYMHRQTCLAHNVNENIIKLTNSGLMESWKKKFVDRSYLKLRINEEPKQLDNEKLAGAYKLLIYGLIISFIVFIVELISFRFKCLHRVMINF